MEVILQEVQVLSRLMGRDEPGFLHPYDLHQLQQVSQSIRVCLVCYRDSHPVQLICYRAETVPSPLVTFTLVNGLVLPDKKLEYEDDPSTFLLYLKFHPLRRWGLHTASVISKGSHIIRYYGEVIRTEELERRTSAIYDMKVLSILFRILFFRHHQSRVSITCLRYASITHHRALL